MAVEVNHSMALSHPRLHWHANRQLYELEDEGRSVSFPFAGDEGEWSAWLANVSSFSFHGQHGQLTVRKEARPRGDQYWYAYQRVGQKMAKKYLGRSADLTLARLEETAAAFPLRRGLPLNPLTPYPWMNSACHVIHYWQPNFTHLARVAAWSPAPTSSSACSRAWSLP